MDYKKGISVIIPVYNAEIYIRTCVASLMLQTFKDLEIIFVIDKNSDDNSESIIKELTSPLNDIKIIKAKDGEGAGYNRNIAIEQAEREYIGFVDVDDYVAKNYYEMLYNNAKKYDADVTMGETVVLEEDKQIREIFKYPFQVLENITDIYSVLKCSTAWDKIYKTEILHKNKNIRFAQGVIHEDNVFTLNLFMNINKLVTTPNAYYYWVRRSRSVTTSDDEKWDNDAHIVFNIILDKLKDSKLTETEKYRIVVHNIGCYAIELFKKKNYYDYYRKKLPSVIGRQNTYELIYKMEHNEEIKF